MTGFCEYGNETSDSIKGRTFPVHLSDYYNGLRRALVRGVSYHEQNTLLQYGAIGPSFLSPYF
jgi:hypothetical protein